MGGCTTFMMRLPTILLLFLTISLPRQSLTLSTTPTWAGWTLRRRPTIVSRSILLNTGRSTTLTVHISNFSDNNILTIFAQTPWVQDWLFDDWPRRRGPLLQAARPPSIQGLREGPLQINYVPLIVLLFSKSAGIGECFEMSSY